MLQFVKPDTSLAFLNSKQSRARDINRAGRFLLSQVGFLAGAPKAIPDSSRRYGLESAHDRASSIHFATNESGPGEAIKFSHSFLCRANPNVRNS